MDNYEEILQELREEYDKCNDLFLVAYNLNNNKYTKNCVHINRYFIHDRDYADTWFSY